jgi:hypothetical protein
MNVDANDIARQYGPERLCKVFDHAATHGARDEPDEIEQLPLRYFADLRTVTPPDKLVRKLMGTTALVLVYGPPGCGKIFLVTDMGLHIALGWAWFGRSVTLGSVIYVAGEGSPASATAWPGSRPSTLLERMCPSWSSLSR